MTSSGQMEQLCWNNVLLKTMELANSSDNLCRSVPRQYFQILPPGNTVHS